MKTSKTISNALKVTLLIWVVATAWILLFPFQFFALLAFLGFENRYTFSLQGHHSGNLSAPPDIEMYVGEKISAVRTDVVIFMPYIAPHLESADTNVVTVTVSDDSRETFLKGMQPGKSKMSYDMPNLQQSGTKTNLGFTVTVKAR